MSFSTCVGQEGEARRQQPRAFSRGGVFPCVALLCDRGKGLAVICLSSLQYKVHFVKGRGESGERHEYTTGHLSSSFEGSRLCKLFRPTLPGAFERNGHSWSEEADLGLLRSHWIIGPPFVVRKSLDSENNE
jgi:hypothetical protein